MPPFLRPTGGSRVIRTPGVPRRPGGRRPSAPRAGRRRAGLGAVADSTSYAQLALETAPEIASDVIVGFADGLSAEEVAALPSYTRVPGIQDDAAVLNAAG